MTAKTPVISAVDIAYVRYRAPDLDRMQAFLLDFGLTTVVKTETALYMRGAGQRSFLHVTELGKEPACLGFGLQAARIEDLHTLAAELGTTVQENPEPGGGHCVNLVDPAGLAVQVLFGGEAAAGPPPERPATAVNFSGSRQRKGALVRLRPGPSQVMRLGHVVLKTPKFNESLEFYSNWLGFKVSDSYYAGDKRHVVVAFLHAGLGATYTDHHTVALLEAQEPGIEHSAFEVLDWDDLIIGHEHLLQKEYRHSWGIGRHVDGSQVFDYWRDPFGFKVEHWTDGDLVNDDYVSTLSPFSPAGLAQWAPPFPSDFIG